MGKKDVTKSTITVNADGTLTMHSDGWPNLTLKPKSTEEAELAMPTGMYEGSVPWILDMQITFNGDGTVHFLNDVKVAHKKIDCDHEAVTMSGSTITFTNIGNTGDCMGDALRSQKKDVTKSTITV